MSKSIFRWAVRVFQLKRSITSLLLIGFAIVVLITSIQISRSNSASAFAFALGVVAAYGFSETAGATTADVSGNANTGTIIGGVTRITTGKFGNAMRFNGSNAAVRILDSPTWKVSGLTGYTISMWVKVNSAVGDYKAAIGKGAWPASDLLINKTGSTWQFRLRTTALTCGGTTAPVSYLATVDNTYHHIALVMDSTQGKCHFYSDGVVIGTDEYVSGTTVFATGTGLNNLYIGGLDGGQYLNADIDEVRLYTRALSLTELQADMAAPVDGAPPPPPPDTTPPVISSVTSSGITTTGATISWTTNEASDTQVEYGTTTAYGQTTTLNPAMTTAHTQALTGLAPGTLYNYRVKSKDAAGNLATSANFIFTTAVPPDTTPPVIAGVASSGITHNSALIVWTTNEGATSQVEYGTTTAYGSATTLSTTLTQSHSRALAGLTANTLYHYRVRSSDAAGNTAFSQDFMFTTAAPPDTTPPVITAVTSSSITQSGAVISWTTDEPATSQVEYGLTTAYGATTALSATLTQSHSRSLAGLTASTLYHYRVLSRDAAGNLAASADFTFTTPAPADTTPPVISAVTAGSITTTTATISWATNEAADTQIEYGTTMAYGQSTPLVPALTTTHSQSLAGLAPGTLYNYRVKSRDAAGNLATSTNFTFTTTTPPDTAPPTISAVTAGSITATAATITWTTNEASDTQVEYGTSTAYGQATTLAPAMITAHAQTLNGLSPATIYHYRVKSKDAAGNLATSANFTFTTAAPPDTTPPVISAVSSSAITSASATINWTTNEAADSRVEYGTTTAYGTSTTLDTNLVTTHSQTLSGLSPNTTYHYRVHSKDAAGNASVSVDFTFTTSATTTLAGLAAAYGFSEASGTTTADASGNLNTGTLLGGVTRIVAGKYGNGLAFNGSNAAVRILDSPTWKVDGLTGYTISLWIKVNSAVGDYKAAIGKGAWPSSDLLINKTGSSWQFRLRTTALTCGGTTVPVSYLAAVDNTYHHIALVMDAAQGKCHFYSDGVVVSTDEYVSGTTVFATGTGLDNLYIGGLDGGGQYLNAHIDEVRLYTRALAQAEIQTDMATPVDGAGPPDSTPPVLSGISITGVTTTGATINWATNEAADSRVEYGTTTAYGTSTTLDTNLVTTHSQTLSGLSPNTTYHYRVHSKDAAGNASVSVDFTFTTPLVNDTTPPVITGINSTGLTTTSALINWTTDEPADSQVEYGTTSAFGISTPLDTTFVTAHSQPLIGLNPNTRYYYRVHSKDVAGNPAVSATYQFTTLPPPDVTPPVISGVNSTGIITTGATINWTTNERSDSRVEYGTTTAYGASTTVAPALVYTHTQTLSGLTANTIYHYRVHSKDAAGNATVSADFTFTTTLVPDTTLPVISTVSSSGVTTTAALITWATDELSDSRVEYGTTTAYGSFTALDTNLVAAHSRTLAGLTANTMYHYRVHSKDVTGNAAVSADFTFTTASPLPPPPPASTGQADPTLLPVANGQTTPATTPVVAGGESYLDPVSGVRIWRATSSSYPCADNTGLKYHDYGDTNQISHEWGDGFQTILLRTCGAYHLVDFKRGVGFSNWRRLATGASPDSDLSFVFSNNPATPRIAYIINGGNLIRYNTATNQVENTGNFPALGWGALGWLQNDLTDTWFVANNIAQTGCKAWNSVTNEMREKTIPEYDECHLENRGRYVELNTGNGGDSVWDLETDTVKPFDPPTGHIFHMASPSGFFTAVDVNTGRGRTPYYRMDPATGTGTLIYDNAQNGYDNTVFHHSGNWVHQPVPDEQQWFLISTYGDSTVGAFLPRAIGFMRLDGSDIRFLAHSYNEIVDYWQLPRAMVAPNGKLVVFDSEFRGLGGADVYVVEVPVK